MYEGSLPGVLLCAMQECHKANAQPERSLSHGACMYRYALLDLGPSEKEHELTIWRLLPTEWQALPFAEAMHLHNQSALTCFSNGRAHVPPFHGPCRRPLSTRAHTTGRPWQPGVHLATSVRCQERPRGAGQQSPIEPPW